MPEERRAQTKLTALIIALSVTLCAAEAGAQKNSARPTAPSLIEREAQRSRQAVLDTLGKLRAAQQAFLDLKGRDRDEDGIGEAGTLADLIEQELFTAPGTFTSTTGEIIEGGGYRFTVIRPNGIDAREKDFGILAWPARPGVSGNATFLALADDTVHTHPRIPNLVADRGPTEQHVFENAAWASALNPAWETCLEVAPTPEPQTQVKAQVDPKKVNVEELARAQILMDGARQRMDAAMIQPFLLHEDPRIRARAAHYLGDINDRYSVPELARLVRESDDPVIRRRAARALSLIRDPKSLTTLTDFVTDKDAKIRLFAATAMLGNTGPIATRVLLEAITTFTDDSEGERSQAVLALHDTKDTNALDPLTTVAEGGARFQAALIYCFQSLSPTLERPQEQAVLTKALVSPNSALRRYAIQRIGAAKMTGLLPTLQARLAKEGPVLASALALSIEALIPKKKPGMTDVLANVRLSAQRLYRTVLNQPTWVQRTIALTPVALLILWSLYGWSRRRGRRQRLEQEMAMLAKPSMGHSGEYAPVGDAPGYASIGDSDALAAIEGNTAVSPDDGYETAEDEDHMDLPMLGGHLNPAESTANRPTVTSGTYPPVDGEG